MKRIRRFTVIFVCVQLLVGQMALVLAEPISMDGYSKFGEVVELTELDSVDGEAPTLLIGSLTGAAVGLSSYVIDALHDNKWNGSEAIASALSGAVTGTLIAATPFSGGGLLQVAYGTLHGLSAHCSTRLVRAVGSRNGWW